MPKPPWHPWIASSGRNSCSRPRRLPSERALSALLLCLMAFISLPAPALAAPPSQRLTVALDPAQHRLTGEAEITLPPGQPYTLFLDGLETLSLEMDNAPHPPTERVELPASSKSRRIAVRFAKSCDDGEPADCRIAEDGASLTGQWHPRLDTDSVFTLSAVIPKHFEAVSEAEEISSRKTRDRKEVRFRFPHAFPGISLVAGPYVVERQPFGNGQTLYSYFFAEDRELAAEYRAKALAYLNRYAELLGPYPYPRFSIVENRLPTGYAMPGFTLLGQAVARLPFITSTSLGHEVLHAWFGNSVLVDAPGGNWSEGLVTALADQTFATERGEGVGFRRQQLLEYQSYANPTDLRLRDFAGAALPGAMAREAREQRAVGYAKSAMLFHMLRQKIGDAAFVAGLRELYGEKRFQRAGWDDLRRSFEKAAGQELAGFFAQWLERTDLPRLDVEALRVSEEEGRPVLDFTLKQEQEQPYDLLVPVIVETGGRQIRQTVALSGQATEVRIPLDNRPQRLLIDPEYDLMRVLDSDETPPIWSRFAGSRDRLAILPEPEEAARLAPLVELLAAMECPMKPASEVTSQELANKDLLFLGAGGRLVRSLLAPAQGGQGFFLEVRDNPLAPGRVAAVAGSTSAEQTRLGLAKLAHYGKYSRLRFEQGRLAEKAIADADLGLIWEIEPPLMGMAMPPSLSLAQISQQLRETRVVYVGETHTRYEDHLLQLRLIRALFEQGRPLAIGMEMFGRSAQPALDRYLSGASDETMMLKESRYFSRWGYDYRLYRDILRFARRHGIPVIGLNQDKEITSTVFREGIDGLSEEARALLPMDRDLSLSGYRERIAEAFAMHGAHGARPGQENRFLQAQAIWDETMAETTADYLASHPQHRMVVLAGNGHTDRRTGIPPRVARRLPGISQAVAANADPDGQPTDAADYVLFSPPASLPAAPVLGVMLQRHADGVEVLGFSEEGKAREAGIQEGDVIVGAAGRPVADLDDLKIILLDAAQDHPLPVRLKRPGGLLAGGGWESVEVSVPLTVPESGRRESPHTRP
ncbi:MAG: ChaN family lipoprotein [Thermodesulfobacteriota bacterium]